MQFGAQLRFTCGCAFAKGEGTAYSKEPSTNVNSAKCIRPWKSFKQTKTKKAFKGGTRFFLSKCFVCHVGLIVSQTKSSFVINDPYQLAKNGSAL